MNYKGYSARVEFGVGDAVVAGRVVVIQNIVGFHAEAVPELEAAVHKPEDDLVVTRAKVEMIPRKPVPAVSCFAYRLIFAVPRQLPQNRPALVSTNRPKKSLGSSRLAGLRRDPSPFRPTLSENSARVTKWYAYSKEPKSMTYRVVTEVTQVHMTCRPISAGITILAIMPMFP